MTKFSDRELMQRAVDLSKNCKSEEGKTSPKVGAVIARDGEIIGEGFRGEYAAGDHGEYTVMEKKLADEVLSGATLYTTLEPCTTRNHPKIPCADRIIERKIKKVVMGILDRNPKIQGEGFWRLWDARIEVSLFDADLMEQIDELNRDFFRQYRIRPNGQVVPLNLFAARIGGSINLTGGANDTLTPIVYIYDSGLGKTITSVNYAMWIEIVNLKLIATHISRYRARMLVSVTTENGVEEQWHQLYSLHSEQDNVFYIPNNDWEKTKLFEFSGNGFDAQASGKKLSPGDMVAGWMLFETNHEIRGKDYKVKNIELLVEDVVGDKQTFLLDPTGQEVSGTGLLNPGGIRIAGGFYDLTKDKYVLASCYDITEKLQNR